MAMCEKCWADAYMRAVNNPSKSQTKHYFDLLEERKGNPCTPEQQRGEELNIQEMIMEEDNILHIPTHQETVDKCFEEIANLHSLVNWIEESYRGGHSDAAKSFLSEAETSIEEIRVLVGGS